MLTRLDSLNQAPSAVRVQSAARRTLVHQTFGAAIRSNSHAKVDNKEVVESVQSRYSVELDGTQVEGLVKAGTDIQGTGCKAASMEANGSIELNNAQVTGLAKANGTLTASHSQLGEASSENSVKLIHTSVAGQTKARYSLHADQCAQLGTVIVGTEATIMGKTAVQKITAGRMTLEDVTVADTVQSTSGDISLKNTQIAGSVKAATGVTAKQASMLSLDSKGSVNLSKTTVPGGVESKYSMELTDCPKIGGVIAGSSMTATNSAIIGELRGASEVTLNHTSVDGPVRSNYALTATDSPMGSATSNNSIILDGSPVAGLVQAKYSLKAANSNSLGEAKAGSDLTLVGTSVEGAVNGGGTVNIKGGTIGKTVQAAYSLELKNVKVKEGITSRNSITLGDTSVGGAVEAQYSVTADECPSLGSITAGSDVKLDNTNVKGKITTRSNLDLNKVVVDEGVQAEYSIKAKDSEMMSVTSKNHIILERSLVRGPIQSKYFVSASDCGTLGSITAGSDVNIRNASVTGDIRSDAGVELSSVNVSGVIRSKTNMNLKGSKVKSATSDGTLALERSEVEQEAVSKYGLSAKKCKSLGTVTAGSDLDLSGSIVQHDAISGGYVTLHDTEVRGTLSTKPGFTVTKKDKKWVVQAMPSVLNSSNVNEIIVQAAKIPSAEEYEKWMSPDSSLLSFNFTPRPTLGDRVKMFIKKIFTWRKPKPETPPVAEEKPVTPAPVEGEPAKPEEATQQDTAQVIELRGKTVVKGKIAFESGNGKVVVFPGAVLEGGAESVVGGVVEYKTPGSGE